ncbi:MrcB family domain-containing protein [Mycobacterium fragae]|uniref:Type IV methyl-directed restriction enzyme EcoKMcrB subunit DNA-binding domain-containing protein n=1 Tax=Mycobacterium fragae TaxID=1260918 RepID=A0A1X1UIZ2_9MYCO|nr:DUF3578 domain-containing protein [Mycobacterium fragae]ORV56784.1 hypothetical protein AWC06_00785 [Mycobacterium fragae]
MQTLENYLGQIDLRSTADLPRNYEAGIIAANRYDVDALPSTADLVADLRDFLRLYDSALHVRDALRLSTPDKVITTKPVVDIPATEPVFKPKCSDDYVQFFKEHQKVKTRRHEKVLKEYGEFLRDRGLTPRTNVHPRDMTADGDGQTWLIEVKVVYNGNGANATREAFAQLFMYQAIWHPDDPTVHKLAVFSESVGDWNIAFLEKHGITSVWKDVDGWAGSRDAVAAGIAEHYATAPNQ